MAATKTLAALVLLAWIPAAWAQEGNDKPRQPDFYDFLNDIDENGQPKAGKQDPPPATTPPVQQPPETSEQDEEARNEAITRNYGETVEIYDAILGAQSTNTSRLDRRIARLEQMLADYRPKYEKNAAIVRSVEAQLIAEANQLQADQRSGYLTEAQYKQKIKDAEKRAEMRMKDAKEQRDFYGAEIRQAEQTLQELKTERQVLQRNLEIQHQADIASGKVKPPEPGYLEQVLTRHRQLGAIRIGHGIDDSRYNLSIMRQLGRDAGDN